MLCADLLISLPGPLPPCPRGWCRRHVSHLPLSQGAAPRKAGDREHSHGGLRGFWLTFALETPEGLCGALFPRASGSPASASSHRPHSDAGELGEPGGGRSALWSPRSRLGRPTTDTPRQQHARSGEQPRHAERRGAGVTAGVGRRRPGKIPAWTQSLYWSDR